MKSIYNEVVRMVEKENTKIGKKALEVLDNEDIKGILLKDDVFWFEEYQDENRCSQQVLKYLISFIKRKMNLKYLYEVIR